MAHDYKQLATTWHEKLRACEQRGVVELLAQDKARDHVCQQLQQVAAKHEDHPDRPLFLNLARLIAEARDGAAWQRLAEKIVATQHDELMDRVFSWSEGGEPLAAFRRELREIRLAIKLEFHVLLGALLEKYKGKFDRPPEEAALDGLVMALRSFEAARGYNFETYANWFIKMAIGRAVKQDSSSAEADVQFTLGGDPTDDSAQPMGLLKKLRAKAVAKQLDVDWKTLTDYQKWFLLRLAIDMRRLKVFIKHYLATDIAQSNRLLASDEQLVLDAFALHGCDLPAHATEVSL